MAEVLLFHHALGLTPGCLAFADDLRAAGHVVHAPDLFDGRTFDVVEDGVAHAQEVGFGALADAGRATAQSLPAELVYLGFSLGAVPAQMLAQTRPGGRGAVLLHAAIPLSEFGESWPDGLPLQIHTMEDDGWGDVDVAREIAASVPTAQVFLYPGSRHLFTDRSTSDHDAAPAALVLQRVLALLDRAG